MHTFLLQKSSTAENDEKQLYLQVLLSHGASFWQVDLTTECVDKISCIQLKPLWQYWYFCIILLFCFLMSRFC